MINLANNLLPLITALNSANAPLAAPKPGINLAKVEAPFSSDLGKAVQVSQRYTPKADYTPLKGNNASVSFDANDPNQDAAVIMRRYNAAANNKVRQQAMSPAQIAIERAAQNKP